MPVDLNPAGFRPASCAARGPQGGVRRGRLPDRQGKACALPSLTARPVFYFYIRGTDPYGALFTVHSISLRNTPSPASARVESARGSDMQDPAVRAIGPPDLFFPISL